MGELKLRGRIWWVRYCRDGRRFEESSHSTKKGAAIDLLKRREGAIANGEPVTPKIGRLRFEEAAQDVINDYKINGKRTVDDVELRIRLHLAPYFGGRRRASVTTSDVRAYIAQRREEKIMVRKAHTVRLRNGKIRHVPEQRRTIAGVSNGEINRELTALKRIFVLAIQAGKLLHRPHIPMLKENNVRTGFFEREQFGSVRSHLPEPIRPVVSFAYITGWRIPSEVLPLQWRNVDFAAGEVCLDPGTTKNDEGRVFPFTSELRTLLEQLRDVRDALKRERGVICPWVFHRNGRPIKSFVKAWREACRLAGAPDVSRMTSGARRSAILFGPASQRAWQWR